MGDWAAVRRSARECRAQLPLDPDALLQADVLLEEALATTGLSRFSLPPEDPLLAGALAVLDIDSGAVWLNRESPAPSARFSLAHELAHFWLHAQGTSCAPEDVTGDPSAEPLPYGESYIAGYSPAQRREVEANVFAAEFLLPSPLVRRHFLDSAECTAATLAAAVGLSESVALGQLAAALLTGDSSEGEKGRRGEGEPTAAEEPRSRGAEERNSNPDSGLGGFAPLRELLPLTPKAQGPTPDSAPTLYPLDASQRAAARADGPVLVDAGPGTGKTRTLVGRALYLLEQGTRPDSILALTFSNRAANEMRERLTEVAPDSAPLVWIGTFHAFGLEILRRFGTLLGLPPSPVLLDPVDAVALLERHLARLPLDEYEYLHDPAYAFPPILHAISRAKDEMAGPDQYAELARIAITAATDDRSARDARRALEVAGVYAAYQQILQEEGLLDFGDLLVRAVDLLTHHEPVRAALRAEYRHVLVDEYQDVNRASAVLLKLLVGEGEGLWAVGDLRQAIYRFRGASPANVSAFESDYPAGRRMSLAVNYRSRQGLVRLFGAAAGAMASGSSSQEWQAARGDAHATIVYAEAEDAGVQAAGIAERAMALEESGTLLSEQCVLCRTNRQAEQLASALELRGVPVLYLGDLLDRPEVKDMLALLSLLSERGGSGLVRVAALPEYAIPPEETDRLLAEARQNSLHVSAALSESNEPGAIRLSRHVRELRYSPDPYTLLARYLFGTSAYVRYLIGADDAASRQKLVALGQLMQLARGYTAANPVGESADSGLAACREFLAHVRRLASSGQDARARVPAESGRGLRLMTVHAAKGLEFPVVYLPYLAKDMFPPRKRGSMATPPPGLIDGSENADEEEERLFFVALSRARDHLFLIRPLTANGRTVLPSPLLSLVESCLSGPDCRNEQWKADQFTQLPSAQASLAPGMNHTRPEVPRPLPLSSVELYRRCPRQYYYATVARLSRPEEPSAFDMYQRCLWQTLRRIREARQGGAPPDSLPADEWLTEVWGEQGPVGHAQEGALRQRALTCVQTAAICDLPDGGPADVEADLAGATAGLHLDWLSVSSESVSAEKWHTGKPSDDHRTAPRHAVVRSALKSQHPAGTEVQIRLRYLATGDVVPVPEQPRYEPGRIAKLEQAVAGIREGRFPADPDPADQCPRCPFYFVCPA